MTEELITIIQDGKEDYYDKKDFEIKNQNKLIDDLYFKDSSGPSDKNLKLQYMYDCTQLNVDTVNKKYSTARKDSIERRNFLHYKAANCQPQELLDIIANLSSEVLVAILELDHNEDRRCSFQYRSSDKKRLGTVLDLVKNNNGINNNRERVYAVKDAIYKKIQKAAGVSHETITWYDPNPSGIKKFSEFASRTKAEKLIESDQLLLKD